MHRLWPPQEPQFQLRRQRQHWHRVASTASRWAPVPLHAPCRASVTHPLARAPRTSHTHLRRLCSSRRTRPAIKRISRQAPVPWPPLARTPRLTRPSSTRSRCLEKSATSGRDHCVVIPAYRSAASYVFRSTSIVQHLSGRRTQAPNSEHASLNAFFTASDLPLFQPASSPQPPDSRLLLLSPPPHATRSPPPSTARPAHHHFTRPARPHPRYTAPKHPSPLPPTLGAGPRWAGPQWSVRLSSALVLLSSPAPPPPLLHSVRLGLAWLNSAQYN